MSKEKRPSCWKECIDHKNIEKLARANGVSITMGHGDHRKLEKNGHHETYYQGMQSIGVARAVYKFFIVIAVVALIVLIPAIIH